MKNDAKKNARAVITEDVKKFGLVPIDHLVRMERIKQGRNPKTNNVERDKRRKNGR